MSRQCLQRSDIFYLTLQRFTVSTYIGDGLQSEDFQTFYTVIYYLKLKLCEVFVVQTYILVKYYSISKLFTDLRSVEKK